MAESKSKGSQEMISAEEFANGWDSERRVHELNPLTFHLRGSTMYVPASTKSDMDEMNGGPTTHVKVRTFAMEYKVWIAPCKAGDPHARKLRPTESLGAAEFGFAIPLKKMNLKLPVTRQFEFPAKRLDVEGGGVVYAISFQDVENTRRDLDENKLAADKKAKVEKAAAKRAPKKTKKESAASPRTNTAAGEQPPE